MTYADEFMLSNADIRESTRVPTKDAVYSGTRALTNTIGPLPPAHEDLPHADECLAFGYPW